MSLPSFLDDLVTYSTESPAFSVSGPGTLDLLDIMLASAMALQTKSGEEGPVVAVCALVLRRCLCHRTASLLSAKFNSDKLALLSLN